MCGIIDLFHSRATSTVTEQTIQNMIASGSNVSGALVNVPGLTDKESCGDLRNSKVIDIIRELEDCGVDAFVSDRKAGLEETMQEYAPGLIPFKNLPRHDAIVVAVAPREFAEYAFEDLYKAPLTVGAFNDGTASFESLMRGPTGLLDARRILGVDHVTRARTADRFRRGGEYVLLARQESDAEMAPGDSGTWQVAVGDPMHASVTPVAVGPWESDAPPQPQDPKWTAQGVGRSGMLAPLALAPYGEVSRRGQGAWAWSRNCGPCGR